MGGFPEATSGRFTEFKLEPWMKANATHLLSHNNAAERPFALMKSLDDAHSQMSSPIVYNISHSRVINILAMASLRPKTQKGEAKTGKTRAGPAVLADSRLKRTISVVASVRMKSERTVTKQRREEDAAGEMANAKHR